MARCALAIGLFAASASAFCGGPRRGGGAARGSPCFSSQAAAEEPDDSSVLSRPVTNLFDRAVSKLSEREKYNTVLQGLMARADSGGVRRRPDARAAFGETWELLDEMSTRQLQINEQTLKSLIDTAAATDDAKVMTRVLSLIQKDGASSRFASDQNRLTLLPTDPRQRAKAIADAPELPEDQRELEVSAGLAFALVAGVSVATQLTGSLFQGHDDPLSAAVLALLAVGAVWDVSAGGSKFVTLVSSGLRRLTLDDPERELECEAASFLVAYLTGLPCFCYSPNVIQAAKLPELRETMRSNEGAHRLLVWLAASAAAESSRHEQLVVSDPRQPLALLKLLRSASEDDDRVMSEDAELDEERVRWAFGQARVLVSADMRLGGCDACCIVSTSNLPLCPCPRHSFDKTRGSWTC